MKDKTMTTYDEQQLLAEELTSRLLAQRGEQAEFSLSASRDECSALRQNEAILAEQACPEGLLR